MLLQMITRVKADPEQLPREKVEEHVHVHHTHYM